MIRVKEVSSKLRFVFGNRCGLSEKYIATFFGDTKLGFGKGNTKFEAILNLIFKR